MSIVGLRHLRCVCDQWRDKRAARLALSNLRGRFRCCRIVTPQDAWFYLYRERNKEREKEVEREGDGSCAVQLFEGQTIEMKVADSTADWCTSMNEVVYYYSNKQGQKGDTMPCVLDNTDARVLRTISVLPYSHLP